jgi:hypothetical protein
VLNIDYSEVSPVQFHIKFTLVFHMKTFGHLNVRLLVNIYRYSPLWFIVVICMVYMFPCTGTVLENYQKVCYIVYILQNSVKNIYEKWYWLVYWPIRKLAATILHYFMHNQTKQFLQTLLFKTNACILKAHALALKEWWFNLSFSWVSVMFLNSWRVCGHVVRYERVSTDLENPGKSLNWKKKFSQF